MTKWKINTPVIILFIYVIVLLLIHIANSQYSCFSNKLSHCQLILTAQDAQCTGPGTFQGLKQKDDIAIYCPWEDGSSIKVYIILPLAFLIANWYLLYIIFNVKSSFVPSIVCLGLLAPLILASGIYDFIQVLDSEYFGKISQDFHENSSWAKGWFFVNVIMEIICAILIGVTCSAMIQWRNEVLKTQKEGGPDLEYSLVKKKVNNNSPEV